MPRARNDQKKKARHCQRNIDPLLDIRRRFKALLSSMHALAAFERMPPDYRNQFLDARVLDPVLVFDPSFPSAHEYNGAYAQIRQTVQAGFDRAEIDLGAFTMSVRDFYALAIPLRNMVANSRKPTLLPDARKFPESVTFFLEVVEPVLNAIVCQSYVNASYDALHRAVLVPLVQRSRLDGRLLHGRLTMPPGPRGRSRVTLTLYAEHPPTRTVQLENRSRPLYQVGTSNTWNGIEYASWTPEILGTRWTAHLGLKPGESRPVYVQSHALQQLRSRLDVYRYADWAQHWMYESLNNPTIADQMPDGDLLVAMTIADRRVGYLVVTPLPDLLVVRTFLFLTMRGTPEGKMLERRLRLTRDEIAYLRLHELSQYTRTDLKDDPDLRPLLSACGCEQLFTLADDDRLADANLPPTPFAAELKRYVRLAA